jgi:hypothetical protein
MAYLLRDVSIRTSVRRWCLVSLFRECQSDLYDCEVQREINDDALRTFAAVRILYSSVSRFLQQLLICMALIATDRQTESERSGGLCTSYLTLSLCSFGW